MHGYQEDRVNVKKGRKETFKNTTEDAFHAAFASTCNFYVINDNKSYRKTKVIYEKLAVNTIVLKPSEFVDYYQTYFSAKDVVSNLQIIREVIKTDNCHEERIEKATIRTYYVPFFFFDFFNMIVISIPDAGGKTLVLLGQVGISNRRVYLMEIQHIYEQLHEALGDDIENLGEIKEKEFEEGEWIGRKWKSNEVTFLLTRTNGHFQLHFNL